MKMSCHNPERQEQFHSTYYTDKHSEHSTNSRPTELPVASFSKKQQTRLKAQVSATKRQRSTKEKLKSSKSLNNEVCCGYLHNIVIILLIAVTLLSLLAGFLYLFITHQDLEERTSHIENSLAEIRLKINNELVGSVGHADFITQEVQKVIITNHSMLLT